MAKATVSLHVNDQGEPRVSVELPDNRSVDGRAARRLTKRMLMALAKDVMKHTDDITILRRIFTIKE